MSKKRKKQGKVSAAADEIVAALPAACSDETKAVEFIERLRWNGTPACVHCGDLDVYAMRDRATGERNKRYLWRCHGCGQQFSVRAKTIFEESRIPLRDWCFIFWQASAGKKGVSAKQIQRQTGLSYKSALFALHRARYAMTPDDNAPKLAGVVEIDESFVGGKPRKKVRREGPERAYGDYRRGPAPDFKDRKTPVVAMIERGGSVRAMVVASVSAVNLRRAIRENVERSATLMTDERPAYRRIAPAFGGHEVVAHGEGEYARGAAHVNTAESFLSRLKRQIIGQHHAVSKRHLHRYVSECAFKHNTRDLNDGERVAVAFQGAEGKRLRYREPVVA